MAVEGWDAVLELLAERDEVRLAVIAVGIGLLVLPLVMAALRAAAAGEGYRGMRRRPPVLQPWHVEPTRELPRVWRDDSTARRTLDPDWRAAVSLERGRAVRNAGARHYGPKPGRRAPRLVELLRPRAMRRPRG